ncbi:uncharacterized protein LOC118274114 [Spodoptera frugiperda]|uniref:Uncharacterized protein LOC118274114 n=1 Tax=Spodoptera frugiperda TaxID=7108 RepID=A0A9R0DBX0_SPOFR|nr:uncharacterized protein LOC118274114 [Spodoptera frugiperda]XP_050560923.1 uncharacterized protein LOC118274114 [Spodoptera frugiperda]
MTSHLDDTDDENCDDPIKLFPIGFNNTANFGSQPQIIGSADTNWNVPTEVLTHGLSNEFIQRHSESDSECTISPMFVKLVDCVKFPWYYKKYTAQLLQKTDPNQFEAETEHDIIDIENYDSDSSDCFIVEDLHPEYKSISEHREMQKRYKLDKELQTALSHRQLVQVDLKRNVGLVGMKISQKKYKTIKQDACAVRKTKKQVKQTKNDQEEMRSESKGDTEKPSNSSTVPVHFSINKIPDNVINNLKPKKNNDYNDKDISDHLKIFPVHKLSKVPTSTVIKKSSNKSTCHVKDIKKCNKYKNDQTKNRDKASTSILIEMLESDQTSSTTCKVNELEQNRSEKSDNKQNDNKEEPNSPILKCTSLKKSKPKPKPVIPPADKCNNINKKPQQKLDKIVNKLKMLNKIPLNVGSAISTPWEIPTKDASTKEIKEKVATPNSVISEKLLQKLDKSMKYYNNHNKNAFKNGKLDKPQSMQSTSNDIEVSIPTNIVPSANLTPVLNNNKVIVPPNTDSTKTNIQMLSNQNKDLSTLVSNSNSTLEAPKQNTNAVGNPSVLSTTIVKPSSKTNTSLPDNHNPTTNDCLKPQYIVHSLPKKLFPKSNSGNSANVSAQNHNTTTKILKSKCDLPVGMKPEHHMPSTATQMSRMFHNPQPQCQNSRVPNIYNSTILGNERSNFPNSFNQSRLPNNKIYQQVNPVPSFYTNRVLLPLPPPPPPMYVPPPYFYQTASYSNSSFSTPVVAPNQPPTSVSQDYMRTVQSSNNNNSSIIGVNNDGLVKKINIAGGPKSTKADAQELANNKEVVSKIPSAEHREIVANNLQKLEKITLPGKDMGSKIDDTNKEKSLEVAIMSKNRGAFETLKLSVDNINMQTKQSKGYSPPILPIPTYHKVLNQVSPKVHGSQQTASADLTKKSRIPKIPMKKVDCPKPNKRKVGALNIAENRRKVAAKKISLEEYNKRTLKDSKSVPPKRSVSDDQNKPSRKRPNVDNKNNRDHNTETDLGYDSDSTVIL